jgi:protein ImuB
MVRLACISLPKIDLQIVALRHPDWKQLPAAVVTEEKPLGRITAANRLAYASGVKPGMRYASALGVCPELRAGVVDPGEREELRSRLVALLRRFTPQVEPARDDPALFWVNAGGLERIYGSPATWAGFLDAAITGEGLVCSVAVGFSRFGTYAAAKVKRRITVFEDAEEEERTTVEAPIGVLPFDHEVLQRLQHLGISTIRDFRRFSPGAIRRRFGPEVEKLQRFASGEERLPVQAVEEPDALRREMRLLYPQASMDALVHHQLSLLRELVASAWSRQQLIGELILEFCPERWPGGDGESGQEECTVEQIIMSRPTLDVKKLERLLRLRLERIRLSAPAVRLSLTVVLLPTERVQEDLFEAPGRRDPAKALAAIGELCAEMGNDAVQIATVEDAHLPERRFSWRRIERLVPARPSGGEDAPVLIRRILAEASALSRLPDTLFAPTSDGAAGPYELAGGWWHAPYRREYYYLRNKSGRLLWIYFDHPKDGWFVQGVVE